MTEHGTSGPRWKAVLFDVDGTLYRQAPLRRALLWRLLGAYVSHPWRGIGVARALRAYRRAQELLRGAEDFAGGLAERQVELGAELCGASRDEVKALAARWMEEEPLALLARCRRPGLVEFLEAATESGIRLAACSDYPLEAKLEAMGVRRYFSVVVSAQDADVQRFKPDPRGLEVALERLGVSRDGALYVGDRPDVDAAAAARAGLACVILGGSRPPGAEWQSVASFAELRRLVGCD
jgi:HAD superfamily hydrolase (TIGR01549 family)